MSGFLDHPFRLRDVGRVAKNILALLVAIVMIVTIMAFAVVIPLKTLVAPFNPAAPSATAERLVGVEGTDVCFVGWRHEVNDKGEKVGRPYRAYECRTDSEKLLAAEMALKTHDAKRGVSAVWLTLLVGGAFFLTVRDSRRQSMKAYADGLRDGDAHTCRSWGEETPGGEIHTLP